jgi:hypothetical protein
MALMPHGEHYVQIASALVAAPAAYPLLHFL